MYKYIATSICPDTNRGFYCSNWWAAPPSLEALQEWADEHLSKFAEKNTVTYQGVFEIRKIEEYPDA